MLQFNSIPQRRNRNKNGSLSAVYICGFVLASVAISSLAYDFYHLSAVRDQLQNAADAAALSGAQDLWTDTSKCSPDALAVAAMNYADGRSLSASSPGTTISVSVDPPVGKPYGSVRVDASMNVSHFFANAFGRSSDTVSVVSVAGTQGQLTEVFSDQMFPLAVSGDTTSATSPIPLMNRNIGDKVQLIINAQKYQNAAFTSLSSNPASGNTIQDMVMQALGLAPVQPGLIPDVQVGESINLNNGIVGQKKLDKSDEFAALIDPSKPPLVMPMILGDPALNKDATIVGFIALKVTDVTLTQAGGDVESITGVLEKPQVLGGSGVVSSAGLPAGSITTLLPGPIQLIR